MELILSCAILLALYCVIFYKDARLAVCYFVSVLIFLFILIKGDDDDDAPDFWGR